jgi:hypothetical protein
MAANTSLTLDLPALWGRKQALESRVSLLNHLFRRYRAGSFLDLMADENGPITSTRINSVEELMRKTGDGGWIVTFPSSDNSTYEVPGLDLFDLMNLENWAIEVGVEAAVCSYYDETSWLVTFPADVGFALKLQ